MDAHSSIEQQTPYMKLTPESVMKHPPMGWNSWDCFGASVTEEEVRANAQYVHDHLKEHGWEYIVVDIQWYEPTADGWYYNDFYPLTLDEYGRPQPSPNRFPSAANGAGFKPLADFVHSLGLKFGIHIMRGVPRQAVHQNLPIYNGNGLTCRDAAAQASIARWNTDMYGTEPSRDAARAWYDAQFQQYADWEVDFVKVDDIAWNFIADDHYPAGDVELISKAIHKTGRPMVLSLSPGPAVYEKREHLTQHAHMWRMTDDFWDQWPLLLTDIRRCHEWGHVVSPGNWPDADMLPLGYITNRQGRGHYSNFTKDQQRMVMNLWSVFRSPLMMGGDLMQNDAWTLELLTNEDLLELNQNGYWPLELHYGIEGMTPDSEGRLSQIEADGPAYRGLVAWTQQSENGESNSLLLINTTTEAMTVEIDLAEAPWNQLGTGTIHLREVWGETEPIQLEEGKKLEITIRSEASLCWKKEGK